MPKCKSAPKERESIVPAVIVEAVNRRLGVHTGWGERRPSCWSRFVHHFSNYESFFLFLGVLLKLAIVDLKARKWSYCISFFSVFLVVLLCVLMFSTLSNLPIMFLRLGEASVGQMDLYLRPGGQLAAAASINYSLVEELFPPIDEVRGYHSPRISWKTKIVNFKTCPNVSTVSSLWYLPGGLPCLEDCLEHHCPKKNVQYPVIAIDQYRERRMGLNSEWNVPILKEGEVILSRNVAEATSGTVVGDTVVLYGAVDTVFGEMLANVSVVQSKPTVMMGMKVVAVVDIEPLKFGSTDFIVMDFNSTARTVAKSLSPYFFQNEMDEFLRFDPRWCASTVHFNMNPESRIDCYRNTEFKAIQHTIVEWVSSIVETLGFNQVEAKTPLLVFLRSLKFFSLFMGLVVSSVLVSMGILSLLLIYSLLSVGVKTRSYELGIQRMLGFTKPKLALMVLFNAYLFAIPAWIAGLVVGQLLFLLLRSFVSDIIGVHLPAGVPLIAIGWATAAGLLLPLCGSIFPIISVVTKKLPDILDPNHGGNAGVIYKITRANDYRAHNFIMLGLGLLFAFFGVLLYYFFPIGLVRMNLALLLYIFFSVLFGMLGGLVLLALNLERAFHIVVTKLCFFWENPAVLLVICKNLAAHKLRNRKITLIYAFALSCVVFITIAFQTQLTSLKFTKRREFGGEVVAHVSIDLVELGGLTNYVNKYLGSAITGITYISSDIERVRNVRRVSLVTLGRYVRSYTDSFFAIPPNFFEVVRDDFLRVELHHPLTKKYGIGESLYVEGEHRLIISTAAYNKIRSKSLDDQLLLATSRRIVTPSHGPSLLRLPIKATAVLTSAPVVAMSHFLSADGDAITSFPNAMRLTGLDYMSVRGLSIDRVIFRVPEERNVQRVIKVLNIYVSDRFRKGTVVGVEKTLSQFNKAEQILNYFFISVQVAVLVICSFSLFSSMTANVMDSSKEIGVYRCIGMSKPQIYRVFMWESFVVVIVGGILGLAVGIVVGYTLHIQNILFTQVTMPFSFPYIQVIIVVFMALFASLCSSYAPVAFLLNKPSITRIFQRTL